jgi:hypothetical protein
MGRLLYILVYITKCIFEFPFRVMLSMIEVYIFVIGYCKNETFLMTRNYG